MGGFGTVEVVRFDGAKDNEPRGWKPEWEYLAEVLTSHEPRAEKDGPAWSPVTYKPGTKRGVRNVQSVTAAVFDVDHVSAEAVDTLRKALAGWEYILHSTHGHTPEDQKLRVVLPVSRPMTPAEWGKVRACLIKNFGIPADPATKDASRLYYRPSCPPGATPLAEHQKGDRVEVDILLASTPQAAPTTKPRPKPTSAFLNDDIDFDALRSCLRRIRGDKKALVDKLLAGEALAEPGARDAELNRAAGLLVYALPSDTPMEAYLELLRPSLEAMESEHGIEYELAKAEEKLNRATRRRQEDNGRNDAVKTALREQNLFQGQKTATDEEIAAWVEPIGAKTIEDFEKKWIVSKGRSYFVFSEGRYKKPIGSDDLAVSLPRDFARNSKVDLWTSDAKGNPRRRTPAEILAKYGSVARDIRSSLSLQKSYYDENTETFHEAVCPLREAVRPVFHQEVQTYLEHLGGEEKEILLDWVAGVSDLTQQCAALFIEGTEGIGKTLLTMGLARLWTLGGPTEFGSLISDFNEAVASCPLVYVDEGFPKKKDFSINDELRRWTGSLDRAFRRKYVADATLSGSIRLIMVANNDRILDGIDEMNEADRQALSRRLIYIKATAAPRDYLESLPKATRELFRTDWLAEHSLWLRYNRGVKNPGKRFLVEGRESHFHNKLTIDNGLNPHLCEFIVGMLVELNPASAKTYADRFLMGNGRLFVTTKLFTEKMIWEQRVPGTKAPTTKAVHRALENMRVRQIQLRVPGARPFYNEIKTDLLLDWVRMNKDYDAEEVANKIQAANELVPALAE